MKCVLILLLWVLPVSLFSQIDTVNYVSPELFGAVSNNLDAGHENTKCIQQAIDYATTSGKTLISSAGKKYYIAGSLRINGFVNIDFGKATLIATDTCKMVIVNNGVRGKWAGTIKNMQLDMNGCANCGIFCENAIKLKFEDIGITGIKSYSSGLCIQKGYEVFAENMHFEGGQNKAMGIVIRTHDCHFVDCVMIDCHTAVDCCGSNFFERIHAWMGRGGKWIDGSTFFQIRTGGPVFLHQCFSDTFDNAFDILSRTDLYISQHKNFHNMIMWKRDVEKIHPVLFHFSDERIAKGSNIVVDNSYLGGIVVNGVNLQRFSNVEQNSVKVSSSNVIK